MKKLLLIMLCMPLFLACSNDDDEEIFISKDAQIYSFDLVSDNEDYMKVLEQTIFTIDQIGKHIFNKKSIPIESKIFKANMSFSEYHPSGVFVIYPEKIEEWNASKSIDFSLNPKIKVIAQDGITERTYSIDIK